MSKLIAFTLIFIGAFMYFLISSIRRHNRSRGSDKSIDDLISNGNKIVVQFDDCEIKTRSYFDKETTESFPSRIEMWDGLYDPNRSHEGREKVVSVIVYQHKDASGKTIEFRSDVVEMPVEYLCLAIKNKKSTTIFVDKKNVNRYYFDIRFLRA